MTLSNNLVTQLQDAIKNSTATDLYWDYDDELSVKQINTILVLPKGVNAVEYEITTNSEENIHETERDHIVGILKQFRSQIQQELEDDSFGSSNYDWDTLINEYNLLEFSPGVNTNVDGLISNTRQLRVVIQLGIFQEHGWRWRKYIEYNDIKDLLRLLNINPRDIHKSFPYHPRRKGCPIIKPKDLIELWDNAPEYGGRYAIPISLKLKEYIENIDHYHTGITIQKGSQIWLHNYANGSGSISVPLQKNLKIMKEQVSYTLGDDRETTGYGFDEVYGLCGDAWNNYMEPVKTANPEPYAITPEETLIKEFTYRYNRSQVHTRWDIRAWNQTLTRWGNTSPKPGELTEYDIKNLCDSFPESAKKYLRTTENKDDGHFAFKIREIIGQVEIIYGFLLMNHSTGEIVWQQSKYDERSSSLFSQIAEKLKRIYVKPNKAA